MDNIPKTDFYSAKQSYVGQCLRDAQTKYRALLKRVKDHDNGITPMHLAESAQVLMDVTTLHTQIILLRMALRETNEAMVYRFDPALNDRDLK